MQIKITMKIPKNQDIVNIETDANYELSNESWAAKWKYNNDNSDIVITPPNQQSMLLIGFVLDRNRPEQISFWSMHFYSATKLFFTIK